MRIKEIIHEYNKGDLRKPIPDNILLNKITSPKIGQIAPDIDVYLNDDYVSVEYYILTRDNNIAGYMWMEHVVNDIWQVKEIYIKDKKQGIGINLYCFILNFGGVRNGSFIQHKKLIHDSQLSDGAEHIWTSTLPKFVEIKIYDKASGKIYELSDIGSKTDDGVIIIEPKHDKSTIKDDPKSENIRFFYIAMSSLKPVHMTEDLNDWCDLHQRYLLETQPYHELYEEAVKKGFQVRELFGGMHYAQY